MNAWYVIAIGLVAQLLFSGRLILQWLLSEKYKKSLTPVLFWQLSLVASFLLFIYGYLRDDFAIMLGQCITYFIYIRNMQLQGEWKKLHFALRVFIFLFPFIILFYGYNNGLADRKSLFENDNIPTYLLWLGIIAQTIFTLRFVYQWIISERAKESRLPLGFWVISLAGSGMIIVYAVIRRDFVLLLGQGVGFVAYARNVYILRKGNG